jgi:hypothetical protein
VFALLAVLFFAASVVVHGAAFTTHNTWLSWQGLALLGLLCLSLAGYGPPLPWLPKRKD